MKMMRLFKIALMSSMTAMVWVLTFTLISLYFNQWGHYLVVLPSALIAKALGFLYLDYDFIVHFMVIYPYVPVFILGGIIGAIFSVVWNPIPEHKGKEKLENKLISSLRSRVRSFRFYCIFLGESSFCIVALGSLFLSAVNFIFPSQSWDMGMTFSNPFIKLGVAVLAALFSALIVWKNEVYLSQKKRVYMFLAGFTHIVGVILIVEATVYLLIGIYQGIWLCV